MLNIEITKVYKLSNIRMVLSIDKARLSSDSSITPSKCKKRLRKLSAKSSLIKEVEEDDTNDDSLKENNKKPIRINKKDSDYEFDLKDEE